MITSQPLNVASASGMPPYTFYCQHPALHQSSEVKSGSHIPTVASLLTDEQYISSWRAIQHPPVRSPPNSLDYCLQIRTIVVSKCIFTFPLSWPRSASLSLLHHSLQTYLIPASNLTQSWPPMYNFKLAPSQPPSLHAHGLQVHLPTHSITASKCISKLTQLSSSGAPHIALMHGLEVVQIYHV